MNENEPKVEQSSIAKTRRRSLLKGEAAAAGAAILGGALEFP